METKDRPYMVMLRTSSLINGMVLARDAVSPSGQIVLEAGSVINSESLALLDARKVRGVEVTDGTAHLRRTETDRIGGGWHGAAGEALADGEAGKVETNIRHARLLRLARMFSEHQADPMMRELCRLAIRCTEESWIGS